VGMAAAMMERMRTVVEDMGFRLRPDRFLTRICCDK